MKKIITTLVFLILMFPITAIAEGMWDPDIDIIGDIFKCKKKGKDVKVVEPDWLITKTISWREKDHCYMNQDPENSDYCHKKYAIAIARNFNKLKKHYINKRKKWRAFKV